MLLSRNNFREGVFKRDNHKCVICGEPAKDAHHILERRLFSDGGYYLDNGASLCEKHHIEAEQTTLDCNTIREKCGITNIVLPEHLYSDNEYDKWGNIILSNGNRLKGELFYDESVQKILKQGNVLNEFVKYVKYPRTYHTHFSNLLKDDKQLKDDSNFIGKEVVVTLKMDGENSNFYNDYFHARSIDSNTHESRSWVKGLWFQKSYLLDDNMRLCGENLYAKHSIEYTDLETYLYIFSMWIDDKCLSWDETKEYVEGILELKMVPTIYEGVYNKDAIIKSFKPYEKEHEGYVIRLRDEFTYGNFKNSVAKYVRPEFRQMVTNSHGQWIGKKVEVNKLKTK